MKRFLDLLEEKGLKCFRQDRIPLDDYIHLDNDEQKRIYDPKHFLETHPTKGKKSVINNPHHDSLFRFFLDGSRRTYKVADILVEDNYLPIVAGQIGAACCVRENKRLKKYLLFQQNLIVLPDSINELTLEELKESIEKINLKGINLRTINLDFKATNGNLADQSVAKINSEMQGMELQIINDMHRERVLDTDSMLILDGSLEFVNKPKLIEESFRHVVGVAKSFNSNLKELLKRKDQEIGTILSTLEFGERTPVFKIETNQLIIGAWYLRIRRREFMKSPMDGIIKVEKVALKNDNEHIDGIDTGLIDNISMSLLSERFPTCYGVDSRWASHLYPIYLTEKFLKSSYKSDYHFLNVF